jgi:hypothetical protein
MWSTARSCDGGAGSYEFTHLTDLIRIQTDGRLVKDEHGLMDHRVGEPHALSKAFDNAPIILRSTSKARKDQTSAIVP